jgi:Cys-tRNA(Pro) deacylase
MLAIVIGIASEPAAISMKPASSPSALKVQGALGERFKVLEFDESTRTAEDAAAAIGCTVAQIAKSLVFRANSGRPVLVVASGANRVDEKKIAAHLGEKVARADADFVREATGFSIGGVPPVAHKTAPVVLIDDALTSFQEIWAAAGTPNAVFRLTPADLVALTAGTVAPIARQ